jgi:hypothetical protein
MDTQTSRAVARALDEVHGSVPALTLWRPWADWVMLGWKTIETRTHARLRSLGKQPTRLAIHAAEKWDEAALDAARPWLTEEQIQTTQTVIRQKPVGGHVLGTVLVVGFALLDERDEAQALIECRSVARYGLELVNPKPLAVPLKMTGRQGIFRVDLPSPNHE